MRKMFWFLVGFVYFLLVWGNRLIHESTLFPPLMSSICLVLGIAAWSLTITLACHQTWPNSSLIILAPKLKRLSLAGLGALVLQFGLGALSRLDHAGLACPSFPLCSDAGFLPFNFESGIAFAHRWWGILMLGLFGHLSLAAIRTAPTLMATARRSFALSVAQVLLGVGAVMTQLKSDSRIAHVAVGYALWGFLIYLGVRTGGFSASPRKTAPSQP
jgi:heme A synthase